MKLSVSNISWDSSKDSDVYVLMKKYNYVGLEIAPTRLFDLNPYDKVEEAEKWSRSLYSKYGFQISSMQSIWYGRNENLFANDMQREYLYSYTKKAVDFAATVGCRNLVFGCPRNRNIPKGKKADQAVYFFRHLGDYADSKHIVIGMEANPSIYHTNYINDTVSALELIRQVDSDGFKLNLDTGTMIWNGENLKLLEGNIGQISHVHISEPGLEPVRKREFHKQLYKVLKEGGYCGFISVEMRRCGDGMMPEYILEYVADIFGDNQRKWEC